MGDDCDGCLGSRKCWVCLGTGYVDDRPTQWTPCHRCDGTGICKECRVVDLSLIEIPQQATRQSIEASG